MHSTGMADPGNNRRGWLLMMEVELAGSGWRRVAEDGRGCGAEICEHHVEVQDNTPARRLSAPPRKPLSSVC